MTSDLGKQDSHPRTPDKTNAGSGKLSVQELLFTRFVPACAVVHPDGIIHFVHDPRQAHFMPDAVGKSFSDGLKDPWVAPTLARVLEQVRSTGAPSHALAPQASSETGKRTVQIAAERFGTQTVTDAPVVLLTLRDLTLDENHPFPDVTQQLAELQTLYGQAPVGLTLLDRELRFRRINETLAEMNGVPMAEHIGRTVREILPDLADEAEPVLKRVLETGETAGPFELTGQTPRMPGVERTWLETFMPVRDNTGEVVAVNISTLDITEHKNAERRIAESEERRLQALDAGRMGTWEWELNTDAVQLDERACDLLGFDRNATTTTAEQLLRIVNLNDVATVRTAIEQGRTTGEVPPTELRVRRQSDDRERWIVTRGEVLGTGRNTRDRLVGVLFDITARKAEEERQKVLMAELDHRVKNILANVSAIARQTGRRNTHDPAAFVAALEGRIQALAHAHSLLSATRWTGADLRELVETELAPYRSPQASSLTLEGEDIMLAPKAAQTLSLAIHELATNAAKYGALSDESGRVRVSWKPVDGGGRERRPSLSLEWMEVGGPEVAEPEAEGFGSSVLRNMVVNDLGAGVTLDYNPTGLVWRVVFPLTHVVDGSGFHHEGYAVARPGKGPGSYGASHPDHQSARTDAAPRVLIVEDAWAVGVQMQTILEAMGYEVIGPAATVDEALALAEMDDLAAAILDVRLDEMYVFPVADRLAERDIGFGFATGLTETTLIPERHLDRPSIAKPCAEGAIRDMVADLIAQSDPS